MIILLVVFYFLLMPDGLRGVSAHVLFDFSELLA